VAERGTIYLICFHRPLHHARHYLGWTSDLPDRLARHASGNGSRLMAAVGRARIGWTLARTWVGVTRADERRMHKMKNGPRLCPRCAALKDGGQVAAVTGYARLVLERLSFELERRRA